MSPISLLLNTRHRLDGVEALGLLGLVADVGVDQERVDLRVDILDGNLEAVEAARLGPLHLRREVLGQVLVDDAVGRREAVSYTDLTLPTILRV